jgi:hypothetical protein
MGIRRFAAAVITLWAVAFTLSALATQKQPPPAVTAPTNADCLTCHEDPAAARADGRPVFVKPAVFDQSIHGPLACIDCHEDLAKSELPHADKLARVNCATCHDEAVTKYKTSIHAAARTHGSQYAASCVDCHGTHDIRPRVDPESATHHLNIAATCAKCHGNAEIIAKGGIPQDVTRAFGESIHGSILKRSGLMVAPTCSDCHGAHDILKPKDPKSRVALANVPVTCGKCHDKLAREFKAGVHGALLEHGKENGPACQTCHTAHSIQRADNPAWQLSVIGQCGTCHANRVASFRDTFHGQVTTLGYRQVAGCADCHGAHEILPASDPRSPIAPANLVKTCSQCHENANENFVKYDPHANKHDRARSPALFYTSKFMTVLLLGVFGTFGLHTALWFTKEARIRRARARAAKKGSTS